MAKYTHTEIKKKLSINYTTLFHKFPTHNKRSRYLSVSISFRLLFFSIKRKQNEEFSDVSVEIHWIERQVIEIHQIEDEERKKKIAVSWTSERKRNLLKMWSITFWLNGNLQHKHFSPAYLERLSKSERKKQKHGFSLEFSVQYRINMIQTKRNETKTHTTRDSWMKRSQRDIL